MRAKFTGFLNFLKVPTLREFTLPSWTPEADSYTQFIFIMSSNNVAFPTLQKSSQNDTRKKVTWFQNQKEMRGL